MKKALMKVLLLAMTLVTLLTIIPLSANASTSNKQKVFSYITEEMGLNSAAACGIMANIERESSFKSSTIIRDSNGLKSGGLCMWNGSRLKSLQNYCNKKGLNYLSVEGQLSYLQYELNQKSYKHILNYLKNVPNNSSGAYDAAYYWCYYFEIPANRAKKAAQRGSAAKKNYWPVYGNKKLDTPKLSLANGKTAFDLDSSLTLKWTTGGKNADYYKLYVAEKLPSGEYDWDNCKIYKLESLSKKISTNSLGKGQYSAFVKTINSATGSYKNSSKVKFVIDCTSHEYKTTVTKQPTAATTGTRQYVCKICGYKTTKSIAKVNCSTVTNYAIAAPVAKTAADRSDSAIRLSWDEFKGADGYCVYVRVNDKWKQVANIPASEAREYTVKKLKAATEYKFMVKFYLLKDGKRYLSKASPSYVTSTETVKPELLSVTGKQGGKAIVKWSKTPGADGYAIYAATSKNGEYKLVATVTDKNATSYTISGLKADAYYFRVKTFIYAGNHKVCSAYSGIKSAIVL